MSGLNEFMEENQKVNRWFVVKVALTGAFCGALLTFAFMMLGFK